MRMTKQQQPTAGGLVDNGMTILRGISCGMSGAKRRDGGSKRRAALHLFHLLSRWVTRSSGLALLGGRVSWCAVFGVG